MMGAGARDSSCRGVGRGHWHAARANTPLQHFTCEHKATGTHFRPGSRSSVFSPFPSVRFLQANEFIRDVFELGPPMLVDSATMKAMKISRFERVSVGAKRSWSRPTIPGSDCLVLPLPASSQLGCIQGPDQGQEQVQGQESGRGRILTSSFVLCHISVLH